MKWKRHNVPASFQFTEQFSVLLGQLCCRFAPRVAPSREHDGTNTYNYYFSEAIPSGLLLFAFAWDLFVVVISANNQWRVFAVTWSYLWLRLRLIYWIPILIMYRSAAVPVYYQNIGKQLHTQTSVKQWGKFGRVRGFGDGSPSPLVGYTGMGIRWEYGDPEVERLWQQTNFSYRNSELDSWQWHYFLLPTYYK